MSNVDFVNSIKVRGVIEELNKVWEGDKGAIYEMVMTVGQTERADIVGVMSLSEKLASIKGMGKGAVVQVTGELTARLGKNGKWWGQATARKIEVVSPAPVEMAKPGRVDDDEIPF